MYEFNSEESFERWRQNEYKAALELGYSRDEAFKILQLENRNDILRYMRKLRKGDDNMNKTNIRPITIDDVKDPKIKDYTTCFYWSQQRNACQCLNRTYCKDGSPCSFWLNANTTKWGETIYQGHKVKHPVSKFDVKDLEIIGR